MHKRGKPTAIRCDNVPELTSRHFLAWAMEQKIELRHIQRGKPTQNAHVESFHARLREECLRANWARRNNRCDVDQLWDVSLSQRRLGCQEHDQGT